MAVAGKLGKVVLETNKVVGIKNWSLELSIDSLETTELGSDWKSYISGLKEWSASSEGDYAVHADATGQQALQDAYLAGTDVTVKLYVDATHYYTGKAIVTSMSVEDPVDDVVSISIEFTGNGELTYETEAA